jgi:hypothetical protein
VPKKIEGLLVACRAFSSEDSINQYFNIIPPCLCYGQAAGTAAALAVKAGIQPRKVDYKELRKNLVKQGVNLPKITSSKALTPSTMPKSKTNYFQKYR